MRDVDLPASVRVLPFRHTGKRSALGYGIRRVNHEILVLSDSDTAWTPGLLAHLVAPFSDPRVGGAGTRQLVADRESSLWRRVASWMLDTRFLDYVPAMGAAGAVPCLSGRTAAYRLDVVRPVVDDLEVELFLGRQCVAGDDGRLTWLVLAQGLQTVYVADAVAISMFPDRAPAFVKQRIRWSRNSYRCYLTAAWKGWLWQQPWITQVTVLQILLTPVSMGVAMAFLIANLGHSSTLVALLAVAWVLVGRAVRGISHLREHPRDLAIVPLVTVVTILIALPVKTFALLTMNRQGWLTRQPDRLGGESQSVATLTSGAVA